MERLIRRRRECPEFGWGAMTVLEASDDAVLAHQCQWEGNRVLAVHNLGAEPRAVKVRLGRSDGGGGGEEDRIVDLLATTDPVQPLDGPTLELKLEGYGYRWFRLQRSGTNTTP